MRMSITIKLSIENDLLNTILLSIFRICLRLKFTRVVFIIIIIVKLKLI